MASPLEIMIDATTLSCTVCGAKRGGCDCWERCSCGWYARRGMLCKNPETQRCSLKLKYGKWNRRTLRYEQAITNQ